jgi:GTP cyclohydrolase II
MLKALNVNSIRLITNNPKKVEQLESYGIKIIERVPTGLFIKHQNLKYLKTKKEKSGHIFDFPTHY